MSHGAALFFSKIAKRRFWNKLHRGMLDTLAFPDLSALPQLYGDNFSVADGQQLGRGPEFYNTMDGPANTVGGDGGTRPDFYNNTLAPENCVGGSEQSCPANGEHMGIASGQQLSTYTAPDGTEYTGDGFTVTDSFTCGSGECGGFDIVDTYTHSANGGNFSIADGQQLGRGPEFYNTMDAPNNCVGGSETSCPVAPPAPPAPPASWYANGSALPLHNMAPTQQLAVPVVPVEDAPSIAKHVSTSGAKSCTDPKAYNPGPGHLLMSCHAVTLATLDAILTADFSDFDAKVAANAESVTPVGAAVLRQHVFVK